MGDFKNKINEKLCEAEDIKNSIKNLTDGFKEFIENGGTAKFILYPEGGELCNTILSKVLAGHIVKDILSSYNNMLDDVRKDIKDYIDEELKTEVG